MKKIPLIAFLLILGFSKIIFAMEMHIVGNGDSFCSRQIYLVGEIKSNDATKIISSITNTKKMFKTDGCKIGGSISLDSIGGDVDNALQLGRYFKAQKMFVEVSVGHPIFTKDKFDVDVKNPGICYSSCVFLLAGGVHRSVLTGLSEVGIHRPYFSDLEGSPSAGQVKVMRDKMIQKIRVYLDDMDINPALSEDMMSIPPNQIKILSEQELSKYRLNVGDANFEESSTAKNAHFYNLTMSEYRQRVAVAEQKCGTIPSARTGDLTLYLNCKTGVMLNISQAELQKRTEKSNRMCQSNLPEEEARNCAKKIFVLGQ